MLLFKLKTNFWKLRILNYITNESEILFKDSFTIFSSYLNINDGKF